MRSDTQTITIDAPRADVFAFLADANNLPRWAPNFASAVRPDGDGWIAEAGGGVEFRVRVAVDADLGTVDIYFTPADGRERSIFGRVLPNGDGAEFLFTLFHSDRRTADDVARANAEVGEELRRLKGCCEAG